MPGFVWGVIDGAQATDEMLVAVGVNGRIAGVSTIWVQDGVPGRFGVLAPESFLRPGRNRIELFQLEGETLRPIRIGG